MARKRLPHERKLRTREHVLADLSVNYVERQILLRGFAVNRMDTDYGIDLLMRTCNDHGEPERTGRIAMPSRDFASFAISAWTPRKEDSIMVNDPMTYEQLNKYYLMWGFLCDAWNPSGFATNTQTRERS